MTLLAVDDLNVSYGHAVALSQCSFSVERGTALGVLGLNGAGKSSLLRAIVGLVASRGHVHFDGREITRWKPDRRVRTGIGLVPEGRHVIPNLTIAENLRLGGFGLERRELEQGVDRVFELFPVLAGRSESRAGELSGGQQQMLAIARALVAAPKLLLLDEPSLGLAPVVIDDVYEQLNRLRRGGVTLVLVEQQVRRALAFVDDVMLLKLGRTVAAGKPEEMATNGWIEATYAGA